MNRKTSIAILAILIILMLAGIGWIFYLSEPTYINNCHKPVEKFDYISIPEYEFDFDYANQDVLNGLVLQVDSTTALVNINQFLFSDDYKQINLRYYKYRIVGRGTIYHKVNFYIGLNIMLITQFVLAILCALFVYWIKRLIDNIEKKKNNK